MKEWKYQLFFWKYRLESWLKKWQKATGIFYIGGSDVFPPPLKPEEEALLLEQLGGEDDLQVKSVLIERNLRLVVYIARKFENTGINVEDLISIGTIGLIKAINLTQIRTSSWQPMLHDVLKMKFSCICAATAKHGQRFP